MAIESYAYTPILVDLPDHETGIKLRARRVTVSLPDNAHSPCAMEVEIIPYERLEDGSYGQELTTTVFRRWTCKPLVVNNNRLVDATTGRILASRYAANGLLRSDADWLADVARIAADETVRATYQADWFHQLLQEGLPAPINAFIVQYIRLAYASGDLV